MISASQLSEFESRPVHVMAKPAGSSCNLNCSYCFYLSKETLPSGPGTGDMSDGTLEAFVREYIENGGEQVVFSWQGGEPTLRGIDFYKRAVELQKRYAKPGQRIENDLQTNGILIDQRWVNFLKENRFLVGLSVDGPRALHDRYRLNKGGASSFDKVMAAASLLRANDVAFNSLTCVNNVNARKPLDVYGFLRDELRPARIQFIPIVQLKGFETKAPGGRDMSRRLRLGDPRIRPSHPHAIVTDWSVDPVEYGDFLIKVFDEWREHDIGRVFVNHFESLVAQHMGLPAQICTYSKYCGSGLAVEHDGSVYSCDHFVYPEYRLGNLHDDRLRSMANSPAQARFAHAKSDSLPAYCRKCAYLQDCWGECPKNRFIRTPTGGQGLNYLCPGLKRFFKYAGPKIDEIVALIPR